MNFCPNDQHFEQCGVMFSNVSFSAGLLIGAPLKSREKCLISYCVDCTEILYKHCWSPENEA